MIGPLLKSFLAIGRKLPQQDEQPRLQLLQLQNFIPVASTNFYSSGTTIIARINSCQQSMLYGSSQAWSEEKIREIFFVRPLYKSLPACFWLTCGKNFYSYGACESMTLHVCDRKVLLNLLPVINITRFIIHGFLRNYTRRKSF